MCDVQAKAVLPAVVVTHGTVSTQPSIWSSIALVEADPRLCNASEGGLTAALDLHFVGTASIENRSSLDCQLGTLCVADYAHGV